MSIFSRLLRRLRPVSDESKPIRLPSPDELALLSRPGGEGEAELLRGLLAQQGIHAMVRNRDAASAQAGGVGPPWAYELWVLRRDLRQARDVLGIAGPDS